MPPTPLPDPSNWSGRDRPFSSAEQRAALVAGRPFLILDALPDFGGAPGPGEKSQVAFLVQLIDHYQRLQGETFVWTKTTSPSRLRLVEMVQRSADGVGPCVVKLIEQDDPARKPFQHITAWYSDDSPTSREPVRSGVDGASDDGLDDPDDISI